MNWTRRGRIVALALALVAVQGALIFVYQRMNTSRPPAGAAPFLYERLADRPSPELTLVRQDGSALNLSDLQGKPVLLHFWATWCPPCRLELPGLLHSGRELNAETGLQVIAVSLDADWDSVVQYFSGDIPPEIVREPAARATTAYELSTLPDTYLISARGTVRLRFGGARNWQTPEALTVLREQTIER